MRVYRMTVRREGGARLHSQSVCVRVCVYKYIYVCIYICVCVSMNVCICLYICVYICLYVVLNGTNDHYRLMLVALCDITVMLVSPAACL